MVSTNPETTAAEKEIVITRVFDAPRDILWKAWTDPEQVMRWWGPEHFTSPSCKIDLRVGGSYLFCMRSPEGQDFWSTGIYREIVEPERIVCTDSFADAEGNVVPAAAVRHAGRLAGRPPRDGDVRGAGRQDDAHAATGWHPSGRNA